MTRILDRLTNSIGLSEDCARAHLRGGYLRVCRGLVVTDPDTDVNDQDRMRFQPESATEHG